MPFARKALVALTTDESGTNLVYKHEVTHNPASSGTAIVFAKENKLTHTGAAITGAGHIGACLNYVVMNASSITVALAIPQESKLDVSAGTLTTVVLNEAQVGTIASGATITTLIGHRAYINANSGTVTSAYAFYCPSDWATKAGGTAYSWYNADTSSPMVNLGATYFAQPIYFANYTVGTVPSAAAFSGYCIMVTDGASGNPTIAYSNGTNWLQNGTATAVTT